MGCNIPRPRKRPKKPFNDGIYGALTVNEIRKRYGLDPAVKPIYINGEEIGNVKTREKDPTLEPPRSPYNCPNCCAPIVNTYCEYCGTRFGFTFKKVEQTPIREDPFKQFQETAYNFGVDAPKLPITKQR